MGDGGLLDLVENRVLRSTNARMSGAVKGAWRWDMGGGSLNSV